MSIPRDSKKFPGEQTDTYSFDRNMKPYQSPCDRPDQHQFQDFPDQYIEYSNDRWNNEVPTDQPMHSEATAGMGAFGDRQFASNRADIKSTGYGNSEGLNIIEYAQGSAFERAETIYVDNSRADRGKDA